MCGACALWEACGCGTLYCGEGGENEDIEVWVVEISPAGPLNPKP